MRSTERHMIHVHVYDTKFAELNKLFDFVFSNRYYR